MKKINHINHLSGALKRFALGLAVGAAVVFGAGQSAHAATTTQTYDLGTNGTFASAGYGSLFTWIAQASLPAGSILRSVSVTNLAVVAPNGGGNWAADFGVYVDPTPGTDNGDGLLSIAASGNFGGATTAMSYLGQGENDGPFTLALTAPANFPATIDLSTAAVMLGSSWAAGAYSGTVTVEYDVPELAVILTFGGSPGGPATIDQGAKTIAWTVPYGTVLTNLAPTYTLTTGGCVPASGSAQNFTSPVVYTAIDGVTTNIYTATVNVTPASSAKDILTFAVTDAGVSIAGTNITVLMLLGTDVTALVPTYTVSTFATGSPASGSTNNFTTPQTYTVTAQDSSTQDYLVTVQLVALSGRVNVNFTGTARTGLGGPRGDSGEVWNQLNASFNSLAGGNNGALWDSAGLPTTIGVTYTTDSPGLDEWGNPTLQLIRDGLRNFPNASATGETLSITNLPAGRKYDVYIASANASGGESSDGVFSTTNTTTTVGGQPCVNTGNVNGTTWVQTNNYVLFANVVPDVTGKITILGTNTPTFRLPVNGVQVVDVGPVVVASPIPTITGITGPVVGVFTINGSTDIAGNVVTLTTPSLSAPVTWTPLQTNAVPGGVFSFPVPQGAYPNQFYRLMGQ